LSAHLDRAIAVLVTALGILAVDVVLALGGSITPVGAVTAMGCLFVVAGVAATLTVIFIAEEREVRTWS